MFKPNVATIISHTDSSNIPLLEKQRKFAVFSRKFPNMKCVKPNMKCVERNMKMRGRQHEMRGAQHEMREAQHEMRGRQHEMRGAQHELREAQFELRERLIVKKICKISAVFSILYRIRRYISAVRKNFVDALPRMLYVFCDHFNTLY